MTRVLWAEYRRGAGPVITGVTAVVSLLFLYDGGVDWPGPWMRFAMNFRAMLLVVGPVVVALAAWQAGRDRHHGVDELLTSTARAPWRRVAITWCSVTGAAWLGMLVTVAVNVAVIAPHGSYSGGGWPWTIAGTFVGIGVHTALGVALGSALPVRLLGPALGLGLVVVFEPMVMSLGGGTGQLVTLPYFPRLLGPPIQVWASTQLLQLAWFASLIVLLLAAVAVRRARRLVAPTAVTAVLGTVLALVPVAEVIGQDMRASELVCVPRVCVTRADADLLPLVTDAARRMLDRVADVPGAPVEALPSTRAGMSLPVSVPDDVRTWSGRVRHNDTELRRSMISELLYSPCARVDTYSLPAVVEGWWIGEISPKKASQRVVARLARLKQLPVAEQNAWVGRALSALRVCHPADLRSFR
ncbi:hypothetical protein [Allokutzneria sp. NRRL B-24872]|uniref:hypothetical protein n=1 Tax=Allokutzneria sp. NRRL B-24872 TaxID=1137961 RepID=UPI000A3C60E6|nr:hypothetical protein [Allokutzneria sp. NRRL B-24872]